MTSKLSDVCTIRYGKDHKRLADGKIPVYGSGGVMRYADTAIYSKKSVLIPRKGTLNNLFFVSEPFWTVDTLFYTEIDETKVVPEYLYYFLKTLDLAGMNVGTAVPSLTTTALNEIEIVVPPIDEQQVIADTLSALDARIAENRKINHHLEQMAQAIFKSWFMDYEPFGGEIPDNWREGTLSEIATITMGQSPDGSSYNEDGIGTVFYQGRAEFGSRFPTRRLFTTQPKRMAEKGDVLMSVRAPVGDLNVAYESCCLGRGLAGIQSNNGCQSFVLYTMFALKQQLDMFNGEGTVFGSINKNDMANLPVLIPSGEVLRQFEELVSPMDAAIEAYYAESCNLQAARDSLLPRLMSGELTVTDLGIAK